MDKIDEIINIIEEKSKEIQNFTDRSSLTAPLSNLIDALKQLKEIKNVTSDTGFDSSNLGNFMSNLAASHKDDTSWKEYTLSPLLAKLPLRPYSKTTNYFGGGIGDTIQVDRERGKPQSTMTSADVFTTMYPGSINYRYGSSNRIRIPCGPYYDGFLSHLNGLHELSELPIDIFDNVDVFEIKKIKGIPLNPLTDRYHGNIPICPRCLSIKVIGNDREQCSHIRDAEESIETVHNISTAPILKTKEIIEQRKISESKTFSFPLNEIFEKPQFLETTQILTVAIGFTRQASFGKGANTRHASVNVRYDPYIGYKMDTTGLMFKIKNISENFIINAINEKFLVRDILIDIFVEKVETVINEHGRSIFELELWLSGIIKTLRLDSIDDSFNYNDVLENLSTSQFRETFQQNIHQEITYYSHRPTNISPELITIFSEKISAFKITLDDIKTKIKNILKVSLSYLIYMSGLITSGSTTKDLDFIYPQESDEIIIYDSASYGNGASKLINNYLVGENTHISQEQGLRPKYFQETFFELLQPCSQGTADRIFFQNLHDVFSNFTKNDMITYRLDELMEQQNSAVDEFNQIKLSKIQNMVPISIGKRHLENPDGTNSGENKKLQEISHICVHGCPECILLNSYSGPSIPKLERFHVSKYLVDLYFKFVTKKIRISLNENISNIENIVKQFGMVIISHKVNTKQDLDSSIKKLNSLIGEKVDGKLIKFSGIWFDCPISDDSKIEISILLSVIE